jgi:exopolyphosphatase/guanosine-5'-triphosphate,3'-diphosphate pyrophosphatase
MPGFTERERLLIANLCRYHRKNMPGPLHSAYQSLPAEEKRVLLLTIPLLRLADNLDRSHERRIENLECRLRDGEVTLQVTSRGDIDLEQWGAEQAGEVFRQVYGRQIVLTKARDGRKARP